VKKARYAGRGDMRDLGDPGNLDAPARPSGSDREFGLLGKAPDSRRVAESPARLCRRQTWRSDMKDVNPSFLLYVLDSRGDDAVQLSLERVLGCSFQIIEADLSLEERKGNFEAKVMGLAISFRRAYSWPVGNVYRLSGGVLTGLYSSTGEDLPIDSHVIRALRLGGFERAMTREEFGALRRTMLS
jgi:hypothetical protein